MEALGVYGMSVVTALTAQNTTGVFSIQKVPGAFTASQIDAVCTDLFPDAVKIGMLGSAENILTVAEKIREYRLKNIVADPVMASTTGRKLLPELARKALKEKLFPAVTLITPNLPEGEILLGGEIRTRYARNPRQDGWERSTAVPFFSKADTWRKNPRRYPRMCCTQKES